MLTLRRRLSESPKALCSSLTRLRSPPVVAGVAILGFVPPYHANLKAQKGGKVRHAQGQVLLHDGHTTPTVMCGALCSKGNESILVGACGRQRTGLTSPQYGRVVQDL